MKILMNRIFQDENDSVVLILEKDELEKGEDKNQPKPYWVSLWRSFPPVFTSEEFSDLAEARDRFLGLAHELQQWRVWEME